MTIMARVAQMIQERKIVKTDLASSVGVAQSTFEGWLGRAGDFPARYVIPMCQFLNVSPEYLLTGEEAPAPIATENAATEDVYRVTDEEKKLLEVFRSLDWEGQISVMSRAIDELRRVRAGNGGAADSRVG